MITGDSNPKGVRCLRYGASCSLFITLNSGINVRERERQIESEREERRGKGEREKERERGRDEEGRY